MIRLSNKEKTLVELGEANKEKEAATKRAYREANKEKVAAKESLERS
jgi:hypothetical protein